MAAKLVSVNENSLKEAAKIIHSGGIVATPTETVYGLAADATNPDAVKKIYAAKGRPSHNPLITHIATPEEASNFAHIDERSKHIMAHHWPGALTLILPKKNTCPVCDLVTAKLNTIALRCPSNPVIRKLILLSGKPLAAPSANISGSTSATTPHYIAKTMGSSVDMILAGGAAQIGLESTVLDLSTEQPAILRYGAITKDTLEGTIGEPIIDKTAPSESGDVKSPGLLLKHYAPETPIRLNAIDIIEGEALLAFGSIKFMAIRRQGPASALPHTSLRNLSESSDLDEAAHNLFSMIQALDTKEHRGIAVMPIPDQGIGIAINDRLRRAAQAQESS